MPATKADIIAHLQRDILALQGFKPLLEGNQVKVELGPVNNAFPGATFPIGAIHEFCFDGAEQAAATSGFIAGILSALMYNKGVTLWISASRKLFPSALQWFGIASDKIIFIDLKREKDVLWAMEEALKCDGLAAVIGEMKELDFTASRRLQLAVEQSRVTGFILRSKLLNLNITACVTRWKITPLPSVSIDGMPGVGYPRWKVELLKVRNGRPGSWDIEWINERFQPVEIVIETIPGLQKKTG